METGPLSDVYWDLGCVIRPPAGVSGTARPKTVIFELERTNIMTMTLSLIHTCGRTAELLNNNK